MAGLSPGWAVWRSLAFTRQPPLETVSLPFLGRPFKFLIGGCSERGVNLARGCPTTAQLHSGAGWGKTGASAGVAQSGLCTAFPQVLQRRRLCEWGECQDGVQEPAAAPPGSWGLHPPGSGRAEDMGVTRAWHSCRAVAPKRGHLCHAPTAVPVGLALPGSPQSGLGLFWEPALAFEFQPCCLQERGCLCGCSCAGDRRDPSTPLRLCHAARVSPDEVFHQLQVHSLCSCHVPTKRDLTSSWHGVLGLAWPGEITQ